MEMLKDGCVDTSALTNPNMATKVPSPRFAVKGMRRVFVMIGGSDAADEIINYQVVGWMRIVNVGVSAVGAYIPVLLAQGAATLGSNTYGAGGTNVGATGNLLADTITNTLTTHPADRLHSPVDESNAMLELDVTGYSFITVDTDLNDAASADVMVGASNEGVGT